MKTGKNIKIELEDDEYTFGFKSNGKAYDGEEDNKLYFNGVLAKASTDYRYQAIYSVAGEDSIMGNYGTGNVNDDFGSETDSKGQPKYYENYVVGTSGTIIKPGKYVKDSDDGYFAVSEAAGNKGAVAYFEDDEFARDKAKDFADCGTFGNTTTDEDGDEEYNSVCE